VPPAVHRELVEGLVESCDGMLGFIQERLERNARESHGGRLKIEPIRLADVLARVAQQSLPVAHAKQSSIDLKIAGAGDTMIVADYHAIIQVLSNLVSNALKFSPPASCVTLAAEESAVDHDILLSVNDEGPGVTSEDQAHLFEPYRRLSAKPTAGESSTGLGLNIARSLVERMGGSIGCDSAAGKGARFWIKIKRA
jgi:signal transduction histidine kinase